jgi:hypothetical protein
LTDISHKLPPRLPVLSRLLRFSPRGLKEGDSDGELRRDETALSGAAGNEIQQVNLAMLQVRASAAADLPAAAADG